jgi:spore maturation protein CgeB
MRRLGHEVELLDPHALVERLNCGNALQKLHNITGQRLLSVVVHRWLLSHGPVAARQASLIWVNGGQLLSPKSVAYLRAAKVPLVLYNNDDPFGSRDGNRFLQVRKSISLYDLCVTVRQPTAVDIGRAGAKKVLVVRFSYDEVAHAPLHESTPLPREFISDIVFVGTWIRGEGREKCLEHLRKGGLNVSIWGERWNKSHEKTLVKECWRGTSVSGLQYVQAIAGAKVAIGLLSSGNRDLHTQRSVEIPYAGGLLCAQRTLDHADMFKEGHEAVFWDSPEECLQVCRDLQANEDRRRRVVANGMRKVRELKVGNEEIVRRILEEIFGEQR